MSDAASGTRLLALILLSATGLVFGAGFATGKFGVSNGIPPIGYTGWVNLGGGILMLGVCALRRAWPSLSGSALRYYAIAGLGRIALPAALMFTVLAHIPAGLMAMVLPLSAPISYAIGLSLAQERFDWLRFAGVGCGLGGAMLIVLPRGSLPDPAMIGWVMASFAVPAMFAVSNFFIDRFRPREGGESIPLATGTLLASALMLLGIAGLSGQFHPLWPPFTLAEQVMSLHFALSALSNLGLFELLRRAGPVYAGQLSYVIALSGVFWGMVIFAETHSLWIWAALVLILVGVAMVTRRQAARPSAKAA